MSVLVEQTVDGEVTDGPRVVAPHYDGQSDTDLLDLKRNGAISKGWDLLEDNPLGFTVSKERWTSGSLCIRRFWVE